MLKQFTEIEEYINSTRLREHLSCSPYFETLFRHYLEESDTDGFLEVTRLGEAGFTARDINGWLFGAEIDKIQESLYNPIGLQRIVESIHYYGLEPSKITRVVANNGIIVGVCWMDVTIPYMSIKDWKITGLINKMDFHEKPFPHTDFFTIGIVIEDLRVSQIPTVLNMSTSVSIDRRKKGVQKGFRVKAKCYFVGAAVATMRSIMKYLNGEVPSSELSETYDINVISLSEELSVTENEMFTFEQQDPGMIYPTESYWNSLSYTHGFGKFMGLIPPEGIEQYPIAKKSSNGLSATILRFEDKSDQKEKLSSSLVKHSKGKKDVVVVTRKKKATVSHKNDALNHWM